MAWKYAHTYLLIESQKQILILSILISDDFKSRCCFYWQIITEKIKKKKALDNLACLHD